MRTLLLAIILFFVIILNPRLGIGIIITLIGFQIYVFYYFKSSKFQRIKNNIKKHTNDCNELNSHVEELKRAYVNVESPDYGSSTLQDTSKFNFSRREWSKDVKSKYVHNCSSTVCKNANAQPFKYLCKYFNINIDEQTLESLENVFF